MALSQVANVATLPGIVRASYAMPDVHWGYGFPIGGVAPTDIDADGVISSGGVGFDISCGVRLPVSRELDRARLQPRIRAVMDRLDIAIPRGVGTKGMWRALDRGVLEQAGLARKVARLILLGVVSGGSGPPGVVSCSARKGTRHEYP
jgi:tRNA-splicing ligase RtcB (3'-phosphate/5'-hydroxy nucleic acid ligase)